MASRSIVTKENLSTDFYIDADKWPACLFVNFSTQFYRGTDGKIYVSSIGGGGGDFLDNLVVAPDYVMRPTAVGNEGGKSSMAAGNGASAAEEAIAFGSDASAASGAVAVGTGAVAGTYASAAYGRNATASGAESVAIGDTATALGALSTAIGYSASASANGYGVALGPMAHADGAQGIAIGMSAGATGSGAIAIGTSGSAAENAVMIGPGSAGERSVVAGFQAFGGGQDGIAIGQGCHVDSTASYAVVVGAMAAAGADRACAIGTSSGAGAEGSTALGYGSAAFFGDSVALGSLSKTYADMEFSIGRDAEGSAAAIYRRITHVADATNDTDAVNLRQLNAFVPNGGGTTFDAVEIRSALDALIGTAWRKVSLQSSTAAYALTDADLAGNVIRTLTSATAVTLTVPVGLTGTEPMTIVQGGAGTVTVAAASGVTIKSYGSKLSLAGPEAWATLIPLGSDTYRLGGNLV